MLGFRLFQESFLVEAAKKEAPGIQHIEHPSDRTFDGPKATRDAITTIRGVAMGKTPVTRKIDDKMSFQIKRDQEGRVAVKYKGTGSNYNYSNDDIERQHGQKPYLAGPLKSILSHAHKVLPNRVGEYQGGFMSTPENREEKGGKIRHTPNTISYSVKKDSPEGKKLSNSKVSLTIHSELKGPKGKANPITSQSEFRSHPDVHLVDHTVSKEEQKLSPNDKKSVLTHVAAAEKMLKKHSHGHLVGHEGHLRTYINSTVDSGDKPNVEGYKSHLNKVHQKKIDQVKTEKSKSAKATQRDADLTHVETNKDAFNRSFAIHHHVQQATNVLARSLNRTAHGGYTHHIGEKESGPEGFVAKGLKVVDREEFSKANRARSALLRAKK
jgi:hypothetical protein